VASRSGDDRGGKAQPTWRLAALLWAVVLVFFYFRRFFSLASAGPAGWDLQDFGVSALLSWPPYWKSALRHDVRAVVTTAVILLAAQATGAGVMRLLGVPRTARDPLFRTLCGIAGLSYVMLALALTGFFVPVVVRVVTLVLAAAGVVVTKIRVSGLGNSGPGVRGSEARWIPFVVTAVLLFVSFVAAIAPETEYDALWYHLELPRQWLLAGRPVDNVTEYVSLYPLGFDLVFGIALAFGSDSSARLIHWACLAFSTLLLVRAARRVAEPETGWLAAAVFAAIPTVTWEATTAYVDLALATYVLAGVVALLEWIDHREEHWLRVAGVMLGFACAIKHLGLVALAATVLVIVISQRRKLLPKILEALRWLILVPLLMGGPWYARGWAAARNPVPPMLVSVFGIQPPERWTPRAEAGLTRFEARFGRGHDPAAILRLPWDLTMHSAVFGGALGVAMLAAAPAVVVALGRHRRLLAILGGITIYVAVWASPVSSLQFRFLLPVLPFLSLLTAAGFSVLRGRSTAMNLAFAALLLLSLPPFIQFHEGDRRGWDGWLTHVLRRVPVEVVIGAESKDSYLTRSVRSYGAWRFINTHLPPDAAILSYPAGDNFYAERRRVWANSPQMLEGVRRLSAGSEEEAFAFLRRWKITHVLIDEREAAGNRDVLNTEQARQRMVPVYQDGECSVYTLR
jgi:4-amino-4-deoxy-L-arabinose transferase-like glycosyltransferase